MKFKKAIFIVVALAILMCSFPTIEVTADSSGLCFLSFDDTLNGFTQFPVFSGGGVYLPLGLCNVIGLSYEFFPEDNTALLTAGRRGLFFDLNAGDCYDFDGTHYTPGAIYAGGSICFPAHLTCNYFGYNFSYIQGVGYGDIVRFKSGSEYLSDAEFLNAATSLMKTRYDEYVEANTPKEPDPPKHDENHKEDKDDDNDKDKEEEEDDRKENIAKEQKLYLTFSSMPDNEILEYLKGSSYPVCFILTSEEIKSDPNSTRKILGNGFNIGIKCGSDSEEDIEVLYNAAQILPEVILADGDNISNIKNTVEGMGIPVINENIINIDNENSLSDALYNLGDYIQPILNVDIDKYSKNFVVNLIVNLKTMHKTAIPLKGIDLIEDN